MVRVPRVGVDLCDEAGKLTRYWERQASTSLCQVQAWLDLDIEDPSYALSCAREDDLDVLTEMVQRSSE